LVVGIEVGMGVVTGRDENGVRKELTSGIRVAIRMNMLGDRRGEFFGTFIFIGY